MSIAFVQKKVGTVDSFTTTTALSFDSLPAVGNDVFVLCDSYHSGVDWDATLADNQGHTYSGDIVFIGTRPPVVLAYHTRVTASSGTFTITFTDVASGAGSMEWAIVEFSGIEAVSPLDSGMIATDNNTGTGVTITGAAPNAQASELVFSILALGTNSNNPAGITDPPTGFTTILAQQDGSSHTPGQISYRITSAGETSAATWSWTGSFRYAAGIVAYKGAASSLTLSSYFFYRAIAGMMLPGLLLMVLLVTTVFMKQTHNEIVGEQEKHAEKCCVPKVNSFRI